MRIRFTRSAVAMLMGNTFVTSLCLMTHTVTRYAGPLQLGFTIVVVIAWIYDIVQDRKRG